MKYAKSILFILLLIPSVQFFSQDSIGNLTIESRYQLRKDSATIPNLQFRYFFNESNAIRFGLGYEYSNLNREIQEIDGEGIGSVEKISSMFLFSLGYEKHFINKNVSPYVGGEIK